MMTVPKYTPQHTTKTVAVVVPLSNRNYFTPEEQISLHHLTHFLGHYDKYLVMPKGLSVHYPGFETRRFSSKFFGSAAAHTKLMLSCQFYHTFREYKFILQYHLDSLVFSDQLLDWCALDFDYIGAPWLNCPDSPWVIRPEVGNGGFSLRKVDSFLRVLDSRVYWQEPAEGWQRFCAKRPKYLQYASLPAKLLLYLRRLNGVRMHIYRGYVIPGKHEDRFWAKEAIKYYPRFRFPPVDVALRFAFEVSPRWCFELNKGELPFGCHAWERYDRAFWEPYLLN